MVWKLNLIRCDKKFRGEGLQREDRYKEKGLMSGEFIQDSRVIQQDEVGRGRS